MVETYVCATRHKMHTTYRYLFDRTKEFHRCPRLGVKRRSNDLLCCNQREISRNLNHEACIKHSLHMKTTVFTKYHIANGAKMAEFAGYNMPIEFTGINDEHMAVRNGAGVFDVSHMGEIWVKGPRALDLLQRITTNDVSKLFSTARCSTPVCPTAAGVSSTTSWFTASTPKLICSASMPPTSKRTGTTSANRAGVRHGGRPRQGALQRFDEICQLAVQGPLAMKIVQKMCDEPVEEMEHYTFKEGRRCATRSFRSRAIPDRAAARFTRPTKTATNSGKRSGRPAKSSGSRISVWAPAIRCVWRRASPLRQTTSTTPPRRSKADWGWLTKSAEGKEFIDRPRWRSRRPRATRRLVGFKMIDRGIPRHG